MNRRIYIPAILLFGLSFSLIAQSSDNFLNSMNERINAYYLDTPHDNLYLHMDRSVYFPGDDIYLSAYLTDAATLMPSYSSNKYNLLLVNSDGAKVYSSIFDISNGKSIGKFQLPENIEQGMYRLIGFSMNDQLATANKVFNSEIFVANPGSGFMLEYDLNLEQYKGGDEVRIAVAAFGEKARPVKGINVKYEVKEGDEIIAEGDVKSDKEGVSQINFSLPASIKRSISASVIAEKRKNSQRISFEIPTTRMVDRIEFHPEGGSSISGMDGKIAFEAKDLSGVPVDFSGGLYSDGQRVADIQTNGKGIGLVSLLSESGKKYEIGVGENRFPLPLVKNNGVAIRVAGVSGGKLQASIASTGADFPGSTGVIVALFRKGLLYWSAPGTLEQTRSMMIPVKRVPPGVSTLVLFSKDGKILSSRTFYIKEESRPELDISLDKMEVGMRQKITASVSLLGKVPASVDEFIFSTSVVPAALLLKNNLLLDDYMMLEVDFLEDVQSLIYNLDRNADPEFLDAMMLAYNWNGYSWDYVLGEDEAQQSIPILSSSESEKSGYSQLSYPEYLQAKSLIDFSIGLVDKRKAALGSEFYKKQLANGMSVFEVIKTIKPCTVSGGMIMFQGVNSIYNQQGAMIVLDNQQMGQNAAVLSTISPIEVESINILTNSGEIQKFTGLNVQAIIEINLKGSGTDSRVAKKSSRDIDIAESDDSYMEGYPDYSEESDAKSILEDKRQLLYLDPLMVLDENLESSFDFYTPDIKGEYVMTIQGMVGIYPVVKRIAFKVK